MRLLLYFFHKIADSPEYERALGALTKERSGYGLLSSNRLSFGSKKAKSGGPIPENTMVSLLNFLFPDAEGDVEVNIINQIEEKSILNSLFFQKLKTIVTESNSSLS